MGTPMALVQGEFGEHGLIVLTTADLVSRKKTISRDGIREVGINLSGDIT